MGFFRRVFAGKGFWGRFSGRGCGGHGHGGYGCGGHGRSGGQPDPEKMEKMTSQVMDRALDWLKATAEQRPQLQAIRAELVRDGLAMRSQKQEIQQELWRLWEGDSVENLQVRQLVDQRLDVLKAFLYRLGDRLAEAHRILNPEQRKLIAARVKPW